MALRFRAWIGLTAEGSRCPREPSPRSRPPDLKRRAPHQLRLGAPRSAVPFGAQPASRACVEERPGSAVSGCRAIETAALPLWISLPLDQVDATVAAIVLSSVHGDTHELQRSDLNGRAQ